MTPPFDFSDPKWSSFHCKSPADRLSISHYSQFIPSTPILPTVENFIGTLPVPIGLSIRLLVNGKSYAVPMATEEPSVIAASCHANKIISIHGVGKGFTATSPPRPITLGQLFVQNIDPLAILEQKSRIISIANEYCPGMVKRGGGVIGMRVKQLENSLNVVVELQVDVCDAMGANCVNTILAGLAGRLAAENAWSIPYKIVSNAAEGRVTTASFCIDLSTWQSKGIPGLEVARRIVQLNEWAKVDPSRAITHNKGIYNGIEAVALATGQDLRALHAAGHLYACKAGGSYQPLTEYRLLEGPLLQGTIEVALPVATVGGCLVPCSVARANLEFMDVRGSGELACVMAAIGLGQNFAALRAIACEGIGEGHMFLHLQNVVNATECTEKEELLEELRRRKVHTQQGALAVAQELQKKREGVEQCEKLDLTLP